MNICYFCEAELSNNYGNRCEICQTIHYFNGPKYSFSGYCFNAYVKDVEYEIYHQYFSENNPSIFWEINDLKNYNFRLILNDDPKLTPVNAHYKMPILLTFS